ncbi:hypothetical protein L1887_38312 [Cichorium endivia]|nr:hypothetical protein L1887_38312 [Cichorium endivia]
MELQLALSLSSSSSSSCSQFDLNDYNHETLQGKAMFGFMKTEDLLNRKVRVNGNEDEKELHVPKTLPLLFCNNSKQDYGDDVNEVESTFLFINHKNCGDENGVIGWPPVKSSRNMKLCHQKNHGGSGGGDGSRGDGGSKSMYVKVQMEGDGIARKIDLNLHHSYHSLVHTLAHMFGKCKEDVKLTYQDKEGDWLLATDVPWGYVIYGGSSASKTSEK